MKNNDALQAIAEYARTNIFRTYGKREDKPRLERILLSADYRWQHTLRVTQFGKVIAENEKADILNVSAACLLHDIAWFKTYSENSREHGRIGAKLIRPFLLKQGFTAERVERVCYAVASHVDVNEPEAIEARILSDADNIDRFGPYRVLQWCIPDIDDYERLTDKLTERIHRLEEYRRKNPLFTITGKQLFKEQLDLQISYFRAFVGEKGLTTLPQL